MIIDEQLVKDLRSYILRKTGKNYFGRIKYTEKNIMVSCPYHKGGQEHKPSCGIKTYSDDKGDMGQVHCFTCGITTDIMSMLSDILGELYNEDEIENMFGIKTNIAKDKFVNEDLGVAFEIPGNSSYVEEKQLREYRVYHQYLKNRNISIDTANVYDIGYDELNRHITFPIRDVYKNCIGIGRRSIDMKQYLYPPGMIKPLYGVYELPNMVRHLWVVEGPFNLWSLYEYGKTGIALLGTGTSHQYYELIKLNCDDYVLALDPDDAGRKGISKLGTFLLNNTNKKIYVALLPNGRDVNDLSCEEFKTVPIVTLKEWGTLFNVYF